MLNPTSYFVAEYDGQAGGEFTELGALLTWTASTGFIITDVPDPTTATAGKLICALISGSIPTNNQVLTQGAVTASCAGPMSTGDSALTLYPGYYRRDVSLSAAGAFAWTGSALQVTHSFLFDGQTSNVVAGEILTFADGQQCEVITVVSDTGVAGELDVRWITPIDTKGMPEDNDAFTGSIAGDGVLNGLVHDRSYSALHLHRLASDLNDDSFFAGNDVMATYKPVPSNKDTDAIINLKGAVTITDEISKHMYGGSVKQGTGVTEKLYSGLNIQITDRDGLTEPLVIQQDAIATAWWANALNPNSIQGRIRIMLPTRVDGCDVDGKRVKGKLLRYGDSYFTGSTTLGTATTALALFSTADGNNTTASATVAGYTITQSFGYTTIDYVNGNGATPFGLKIDFAAQTSKETYERTKYNQREDSAETLFGRNARLFDGFNLDIAYDAESGGPFNQGSSAEVIAWGTQIPYTGLAGGTFTVGNVLVGTTSGARGRILYDDGVDFAVVALEGTTNFSNTEALTERSGGTTTGRTATTGTVVNNTAAGTALLCALDDDGSDGNLYCQQLQGVAPSDNQKVYGRTTAAYADVVGSPATRVVNNQYVGVYTGTNFQTNRGIGLDATDGIAGDIFPNLLGVNQLPPDSRTCEVTGLEADYYITIYPWDGVTYDAAGDPEPDFNEMTLGTTLTAGVSTTVVVGSIPNNTPQVGFLRIERDSDNEYFKWEYTAHNGTTTFTMVGTAPFTATAANDVMRAPKDGVAGATSVTFSAIIGTPNQWAISAKRGGTTTPIKPAKATATFPFTVNIQAQSDA
jgi:hypothetical protein